MPCKKIAPVYHELAELNDAHFTQVTVDDVDLALARVIGAQFQVTFMPTFCIVSIVGGGKDTGETTTVVKMSGSDERTLRSFMADRLKRRKMD
jgi:thiol-disulfide isomerase/thioredoxin